MRTDFFKSSYSGGETTCVEIAHREETVLVRDSKHPGPPSTQPTLTFTPTAWTTFTEALATITSPTSDL